MTLRLKLLVLVAAVTLFAATGVTSVALWRGVLQVEQQLSQQAAAVAASIAAAAQKWAGPSGLDVGAPSALLPLLRRELRDAELLQVSIIGPDGVVALCADARTGECGVAPPLPRGPEGDPFTSLRRLVRNQPLEADAPIVGRTGEAFGTVRISFRSD